MATPGFPMNWPPKISIVTPSYNQAAFLEQTLMSVLGQGYPNLEYLVVDDGSTDGSPRIIERYADHLAYWHSGLNRGQAAAINHGLQHATGELCAYLNSDDKLIEGSLWKMAYLARRHPACQVFYGANHIHFEQTGGVLYECPRPWPPGGHPGFLQEATFWRREVHEELGGFDTSFRFALCGDFFTRALLTQRSLFHSEPMSIIRNHPATKTNTISDVSRADAQRLKEQYATLHVPLAWRLRARGIALLAGLTAKLGRRHAKLIWRCELPPIQETGR